MTGALHSPVREMCERLAQPFWMPAPTSWHWHRPDGVFQTLYMHDEPGITNLLWLSMDMVTPPTTYQMGQNELASLVVMFAPSLKLPGGLLADAAAVLPLREFDAWLERAAPAGAPTGPNPLAQALPLFKLFIQRRLRHE